MTWDYYKNTYGRNGIFGNGAGSYNRVALRQRLRQRVLGRHEDDVRRRRRHRATARWSRSTWPATRCRTASPSTPPTSPTSGESGGLNEATSDIFGTMVEFYANNANDPGDYLIGEEFDLKNHARLPPDGQPGVGRRARSTAGRRSAGNADVHYSSGVGNHFFYLLAEGSGAKTISGVAHNSPTCNGSTVTGIGRDRRRADLVPRADGLHDVEHQLRRCSDGDAERGP